MKTANTDKIQNPAKEVRWNLTDLYLSIQDPAVDRDLKELIRQAGLFQKNYKPLFENTASKLNESLPDLVRDFKSIVILINKLWSFSYLAFAEQTDDQARGAFRQKIKTALADVQTLLNFFQVHWVRLPAKEVERLLQNPHIESDRHYLEKLSLYAPHTLAEGEENIMALKNETGPGAFSRLFDEIVNRLTFDIEIDGRLQKKNEAQTLALLHSPERDMREKAALSLGDGLKVQSHLMTYIYNMVLADHRLTMKIRNFSHPIVPMNLSNEIDPACVDNLIASVRKAYPIAQRYYVLKKKILGLDVLYDYDRYAPCESDRPSVGFDDCKKTVLEGYFGFSPRAGEIATLFFEKRWIDAEIRNGKMGGGFCCQTIPDLHPYILVNYTGSMRDVMTVAHEIGHGLHQYLAGKRVGILEFDAPLVLAETASVFGEMLVFEKILEKEKDPKKRLGLLMGKIDDHLATVYRQIAMTVFELKSHEAGVKEGELSAEKFSDFWMEANAELYGKSVVLTDNYRQFWKYIPHFVHTPFYCYSYAFAQLFVLSLYQQYKQDRGRFIANYFELLSLGGSKSPAQMAAMMGLDINRPAFFEAGLSFLGELISDAEKLAP